jgi:acyl-coenzyme A synthetase/AMP-(fatty) acid ligase
LANGAALHLAPERVVADPPALVHWLRDEGITLAFLPTPLAEAVLAEPAAAGLSKLRRLLTGGDRLRLRPPAGLPFELVNHYGPTESSVVATWGRVDPRGAGLPSLGAPVDNLRVYLLDRRGRPVPLGAAGELCIAGAGLARGYAGRPADTAASFVPDPWGEGGRLYRTGDLARRTADGELAFLGRGDQQVQIRGFRVEPGEVEAALRRHPAVREAAVVVHGEGDAQRLVGYAAVAPDASVDGEALRRHLGGELPAFLVPADVVVLAALPVNASGKLDRAALPDPDPASEEGYLAPRSELEELLAAMWGEALGRDGIGVHDDFFALGGQSLLVTRLAARLRDELGVEMTPRDFFAHPTIAGLSVAVAQRLMDAAADEDLAAALSDLDRVEP